MWSFCCRVVGSRVAVVLTGARLAAVAAAGACRTDDVDVTFASGIAELDIAPLLPPSFEYYSYRGSLTTPNCTEGPHSHAGVARVVNPSVVAFDCVEGDFELMTASPSRYR